MPTINTHWAFCQKQISRVLEYLYYCGVADRNINDSNMFINDESGINKIILASIMAQDERSIGYDDVEID